MKAPEPFALERNLALTAGAGAGKTYSLITLCLHLLGGAREDGVALRPSQLCLLTFTDKAASEMRTRLRKRLDGLATGESGDQHETELRASFARYNRPFPKPDFWRQVRDDLGAASIGTFHSLCIHLLRRAPAGFGVEPGFEILDERDAAQLVSDVAERVVLEALERGDPAVSELCRELNFGDHGRAAGLVGYLCFVLRKAREEGQALDGIGISDPAEARRQFDEALAAVKASASRAVALDFGHKRRFQGQLSACMAALEALTFEDFPARFPAVRRAMEAEPLFKRQQKELGDALKEMVYGAMGKGSEVVGLREHYGACQVVVYEDAFRKLLAELAARHREALGKGAAMDFSELLIRTRDLLRDHPLVRREVQERMRALLVDEFQDTNRLQLEMVTLLAEQREGAPRQVSADGVLGLPLEPRFLCVVGDRKQSIYEFRGADVSVFGLLARQIEAQGGEQRPLKVNRRSSPKLLSFFNGFFSRVLRPQGAEARDFEVVYEPERDDLEAFRAQRANGGIERIVYEPAETIHECRQLDADAVARRIRQLLAPKGGLRIEGEDKTLRRPKGSDIALLFRRFSYLEVYRHALIKHGIPHRVVRGRGFYGAQEVLDMASLLALVADEKDVISLAAVLRSPLVALSDASLFKVALAGGRKLSMEVLRRGDFGDFSLPPAELARLGRFVVLFDRLRRERDRLGIRVMLQVALEETGYRVAVAGTPYGEQALANLEKLLELAARRDARNTGDCAAFAAELLELADADPTEAQADILDAGDPRAVQLLTIHQAKGLEWPIVFVPDMAVAPRSESARILFDRRLGLAIKPWVAGETGVGRSPRLVRVADELHQRESAEHRRLLYVALTRARDHLVLSGQAKRQARTWRELLDRALEEESALRALVTDVPLDSLPDGTWTPPPEQGSLLIDGMERVEAAERRVRAPAPLSPASAVFPVTQLQDYVLCPRRYFYAHQVGLAELNARLAPADEGEDEGAGGRSAGDRRLRGTLAHLLLEQVDLELVGGPEPKLREHLEGLLWLEGHDPKDPRSKEIVDWALGFLRTPFAARLKAAGRARVHRELPFVLRLGGKDGRLALHLRGQIDLLFEDEQGGATVIDYKSSVRHAEGLAPYAFQLDCYALAARNFVREGVPIRTGIAFLREPDPGPDLRPIATAAQLDQMEERLVASAVRLLANSRSHDWPGLERTQCQALGCGFMYRCHGPSGA